MTTGVAKGRGVRMGGGWRLLAAPASAQARGLTVTLVAPYGGLAGFRVHLRDRAAADDYIERRRRQEASNPAREEWLGYK